MLDNLLLLIAYLIIILLPMAAVGSLMTSILITVGRKCIGYTEHGRYVRGAWDMSHKLMGV